MNTPFNPDSIGDYLTLILIAALTFSVPAYFANRKVRQHTEEVKKSATDIAEIKHHTVNDHKTNMRDDLDEMRDLILAGFAESRREFQLVHEAINLERRDRIEGDRIRIEAQTLNVNPVGS